MNKFKIALVQMAMTDNRQENMDKALEFMTQAAAGGAQVICLPELFLGKYFCQVEDSDLFDLAEPVPGPATDLLAGFARARNISLIASLFEKRTLGLYHNTAAVITPDGLAGIYRKMHIPDDPAFYEKFYFTPGDLGFKAFDTPVGRIGTLICWDQWYPEAARLTALRGPQVLFYPTAIGWHPQEKSQYGAEQREAWITVQRGHAVANGIYVAAANRVGFEAPYSGPGAGLEFFGSSFIADPMGQIIAQAGTDTEEIIYADIDPARIEFARRGWPFFRDRRIDAFGELTRRFIDE